MQEIASIMRKTESLQRELEMLGEATSSEHCAALYAYTLEEPDLYGKLNHACRTPGGIAEKRLGLYRDFLHHMTQAGNTLTTFRGKVSPPAISFRL